MSKPRLNPVILLAPAGEGFVAYDPAADLLHTLNPVAALLAELCDGTRGAKELEEIVAPLMPQDQTGAVEHWLAQATASGLLVAEPPDYSVRDRARIALRHALFSFRRLDDSGPAEALYNKARQAVAADAADWDSWHAVGKIAQLLGHGEEARGAYRHYLDGCPEDGEVAQILMALNNAPPPPGLATRRCGASIAASPPAMRRGCAAI